MRTRPLLVALGAALGLVTWLAACGGHADDASLEADQTGHKPTFPADAPCTLCTTNADCASGVCAQFQGDTFCAPRCSSTTPCGAHETCDEATSTHGAKEKVCVPDADVCGATPPKTAGGTGPLTDHGAVVGTVGENGGKLSRLRFAVVGDTRPPIINDTKGYPSATIKQIYSDIQALRVPFVVTSGDYVFSAGNGTQAAPQFDLYLAARSQFAGTVFPALGNHECDGAVTSNCGPGGKTGETANYTAFRSKLLAPIGKSEPWYSVDVDAQDGSWSAKLVFVAANAWNATQQAWLETTLAKPTTYTFIIRHEPSQASQAPGVTPSEQIMARHPYTLAIVGHTHTYGRTGPRQVTIGNGGAPLVSGTAFGFGLIDQRPDKSIEINVVEAGTGKADTAFRFALKPDGSPAP